MIHPGIADIYHLGTHLLGSLENLVNGLRNSPNVPYVWSYMTYSW